MIELPIDSVHITKKDLGEVNILKPKLSNPSRGPKGICFAPDVEYAIEALPLDYKNRKLWEEGEDFVVYSPIEIKKAIVDPENTGELEFRVTEPIAVERVGKLLIKEDKDIADNPNWRWVNVG